MANTRNLGICDLGFRYMTVGQRHDTPRIIKQNVIQNQYGRKEQNRESTEGYSS